MPISDDFWSAIEPLIPQKSRDEGRAFRRQPGAGRKPIPPRQAFEAVIYVLRTGTPWKRLPKSFGSASAIHRHFDAWHAAGFFTKLWHAGLAEYDEMEGISWHWHKAPTPRHGDEASFIRTAAIASPNVAHPTSVGIPPREWRPSFVRRRQKRSANFP